MTSEMKDAVLWLKSVGVKHANVVGRDGSVTVEFWAPPQEARPTIDIDAVLRAPMSDDELLAYDVPDHLQDPPDIDTDVKK